MKRCTIEQTSNIHIQVYAAGSGKKGERERKKESDKEEKR
jgi:hypothetical protein